MKACGAAGAPGGRQAAGRLRQHPVEGCSPELGTWPGTEKGGGAGSPALDYHFVGSGWAL